MPRFPAPVQERVEALLDRAHPTGSDEAALSWSGRREASVLDSSGGPIETIWVTQSGVGAGRHPFACLRSPHALYRGSIAIRSLRVVEA